MPRSRSPEPSSHSSSKRSKQSHHSSHRDRSLSPAPKRSRDDDDRRKDRDSDRRPRDHRDSREDDYRRDRDRSDRDRDSSRRSGESDRDRERERDRRDRDSDRRYPTPSSSSSSRAVPNGSPNGHHLSPSGRGVTSGSVRSSHASASSSSYPPPSSDSRPTPSSVPAPPPAQPAAPELSAEDKLKAKRERLAAWKAKQGATAVTSPSSNPGSPAPLPSSTTTSATTTPAPSRTASPSKPGFAPIPAKPTFSFGGAGGGGAGAALSRIGLPFKPSALSKSSMTMDDGPAPVRKLEKLGALPAVDTKLVVPHDDEDEDELDYEFKASVKGGERGPGGAATTTAEAMDVDPTPAPAVNGANGAAVEAKAAEEDDEEIDPLDAYMLGVTQERVKVDAEDSSRMKGGSSGAKRGRALGVDDDEGGGEGSDDDEVVGDGDKPITAEDIIAMAAAKNRRKELPTVDHSVVSYEPFRKAFYTPPYEVTQMTDDEVDLMRLEMDGIKIRGVDCPRPVKRWGAFGLPGGCLEVIKRLGYEEPTSIQAQAIPAIMSGRDVIGVAKTGSGKTIAFLLPLLRHINDQPPLEPGDGPLALIMTPTRELALQIVKECKPFAKVMGITAMAAYGGSPIGEQISELKKGAEIVVGTPGRMIDLLTANSGRVTNLKRVTYLVLDEADRMFDMGFEPQVMKIINNVRPGRQIVLFSATFPKQMDGLARKILQKPLEVTVGGRSVVGKEIEQLVEVRTEETKFNRLLELLGETYQSEADLNEKRTLIFVERQEAADNLLLQLHQKSYRRVNSLHGGKEQVDRDETINNFKSGILPIVIATSVAARGLDVKQLVLVINYDVPNHMEDYVHRAGRTGRAGNKGTCVTFITPDQEKFAVDISRAVEASYAARIPPLPAPERFVELKALADGFLAKVRSGAVKSFSNTGFGGKGLERFESDREKQDAAERSHFGEDKDEKKDGEKKDGDKPAPGKDGEFTLDNFTVDIVKGPAPERVGGGSGASRNNAQPIGPPVPHIPISLVAGGPNQEGVNKVQAALNKINAELAAKKKAMQAAAANPAPPPPDVEPGSTSGVTQKTVLSTDRKPKDPDATDYHAVVMINDFIQKARWMVTNRDSIVKLIDLSGAAITNRGVFYEAGKGPSSPSDEPKLSLLIESNESWRVEAAVKEIKRLLIEGTILGLASEARQGPGHGGGVQQGRYQIA